MRRPRPPARTDDARTTRRPGRALATATAVVLLLGAPATAAVVGADDVAAPSTPTLEPAAVEPSVPEPSVEATPATEQPTDGPEVAEPSVEAPVPTEPTDQPSTEPTTESTTGPSTEQTTGPTTGPTTDAVPDGTGSPPETSAPSEAEATTADEDTELLACASDGPQDVAIELVRHGIIEVTWAPPIPLCGRVVEGYEITLDGEVQSGYLLQYSGFSWEMLAAPGPHTVSVVALTTDGRSQPTSADVVMPEPGLTWPAAPQGVTAVQTGADEVTIAWSAPAVPGSSPVTGYDVGVGTMGWGNGYSLAADARSSVQDGLEPGVLYYLSVAAENESGGGPRVFVELELTAWEAPSVPRAVVASQSGPGEVTVGWDEPADAGSYPVSGYRVEVTSSGAAGLEAASTAATTVDHPADARSAIVAGLGTGSHVVRVSALNTAGSSEVASVQVTVVAQVIAPAPVGPTAGPTGAAPVTAPAVAGRPGERSVARTATAHQLARTGADAGVLALGALLGTALGAGLLVASRRPAGERRPAAG